MEEKMRLFFTGTGPMKTAHLIENQYFENIYLASVGVFPNSSKNMVEK